MCCYLWPYSFLLGVVECLLLQFHEENVLEDERNAIDDQSSASPGVGDWGEAGESNPCLWTNHSPTNTTHTIAALPAQMDSPAYSFDPF